MKINSDKFNTAIVEFKEAIDKWQNSHKYRGMDKVYASDRKDLRKVLSLFRKKDFRGAWNSAQELDTIVRDQIPDSAWNMMQSLGEYLEV